MGQLKGLEDKVGGLQRELSSLREELKSYEKAGKTYETEQKRLHEIRHQRDALIQQQCDALTERSTGAIRAAVHGYSNANKFAAALREKLSGSNLRMNKIEQTAQAIVDAEDPHRAWLGTLEDLENLANFDPNSESNDHMPETPFLTNAGATKADCEKLARKLDPEDWLALSLTEIESEPYFEYRSREGEYINFANASSGQQATALLRTLLEQLQDNPNRCGYYAAGDSSAV